MCVDFLVDAYLVLGSSPAPHKQGTVVHACNPSIHRSSSASATWGFEPNLDSVRPCSQIGKKGGMEDRKEWEECWERERFSITSKCNVGITWELGRH